MATKARVTKPAEPPVVQPPVEPVVVSVDANEVPVVVVGPAVLEAATAPIEPPAPPIEPPIAPVTALNLRDYIREQEDAAEALGVVLTHISHPDASGEIMQGRYSGIRTSEGNPAATYSDGSTH